MEESKHDEIGPINPLKRVEAITPLDEMRDAFDAAERALKETPGAKIEDDDAMVYDMHRRAIRLGELKKKMNSRAAAAARNKKKNRAKNKLSRRAKRRNRK